MRLSASQLGAWERCPTQYRFEKIEHRPGVRLSATQYGTVVHHAVHAFERAVADGKTFTEALDVGLATFDYYWHPEHIAEVADGRVEEWIKGQSYGSLRHKGLETIQRYAMVWTEDEHTLLSLEHPFEVQVDGTEHTISGYVDRLVLRKKKRQQILAVDDWKTGKRHYHLRHHLGLTVYAYASTKREFWEPFAAVGADPDELFASYAELPRHTVWYDLNTFARLDGGYRGPADYARLAYACTEVARSVAAGIFPLRISGDTCGFCPHAGYCPDGSGLPAETEGSPG